MDDGEAAKQYIVSVFDRASPTYDRTGEQLAGVVGRTLVERAAVRTGERVLELGCGRGAATFPAAERVGPTGHVLALDLAEGMVRRTREDLEAMGLRHVVCRLGDADVPDAEPGGWELVLASLVLFFLPDPERAMRSYRGLLRPGGRLAFSWFVDRDPRWEPVYAALVADLPEEQRGPRRPGQQGPFSDPATMDAFLTGAGYASTTQVEAITLRYPDEATWWSTLWSHGVRATMEKLRDAGVLETTMARVSSVLDAVRAEDGSLVWVPQMAYTIAVGPGRP